LIVPESAGAQDGRWVLVDKTCQILIAGEHERIVFVFPTSTGERGYETRDQDRARAFRYDPAADNYGWHDSIDYPSAVDNPLNGNMYHPIYFDDGLAIHGANNVPPEPASKGCVRLRVEDQDALVAWLGLTDRTSPTWDRDRIGLTVTVQGTFVTAE
jgi:lipoprotein-anchoring transpeptidase ErfK/SrfK